MIKSCKIQSISLLLLWLISMVLSAKFVLSVSMISLLILALLQLDFERPCIQVKFSHSPKPKLITK